MEIQWYGQSSFRLAHEGQTVFIDPFGDMSSATARGIVFDYPPIHGVEADLLLVTHEHGDHNGVEAIAGDPAVVRSRAGRHQTPIGEVVGIASEHDDAAGSERGDNTIFVFTLGGRRIAHFGDFGQAELRPAQRAALGEIDILIVPVGGGPTIDAAQAAALVAELTPDWVLPMHYRTERTSFLEPADDFLARFDRVQRLTETSFELEGLPDGDGPLVVVPAAP